MDYTNFYMSENATINYFLARQRENLPNKIAFTFLEQGEEETATITYNSLYERSEDVAKALYEKGIHAGDRALLLFPSCIEYVVGFLGCLRAGVIAVPLFPPQSQKNSQTRMETVSLDCSASAILTTSPTFDSMKSWLDTSEVLNSLPCIFPDIIERLENSTWVEPRIIPESIAFLQYTSGSTSSPKGVVVTHRNLIHNEESLRQAMQHDENTVIASWLPIFHDMGLIGNILQTLYLGGHCVFMPPIAFVQKPNRWLKVISKYRCHSTMAPNFAYDLCCERVSESDKKHLDLSSWKCALNGSEPVRYETLENFAKYFADCGFSYKTLYPGYGLAEATLMVTSPAVEEDFHHLCVSSEELANNKIIKSQTNQTGSVELVSSGRTWCNTDIAIVNPSTLLRCAGNEVGEIWVHNASVGRAYWNNTAATEETFYAQIYQDADRRFFMRTGDLGFMHQDNLYITGRHKELVLIRGQNYYPQDIERSIQNCNTAFVINGGAAFYIESEGEEKLVVVQEIKRTSLRKLDIEAVVADAHKAISSEHELKLHCICLIKPARLSKTSSGKIQRRAMKEKFLSGDLESIVAHYYSFDGATGARIPKFDYAALDTLTGNEKIDLVKSYLSKLVTVVTQSLPASLPESTLLIEFGLDSMALINLQHLIVEKFSIDDAEALFNLDSNASLISLSDKILDLRDERKVHATNIGFDRYLESLKNGGLVSHNQKSLWLVQNLQPESYAYNVVAPIEIYNALDIELFRKRLSLLVNIEEVFGQTFEQTYEGIRFSKGIPPHLDSLDCRNWSEEEVQMVIDKFWKRPFDLATEIPARFLLIRKNKSYVFIPVMHHIITDMWSMLLFIEKLFITYQNGIEAQPNQHPYSRFAHEQNLYFNSEASKIDEKFWSSELKGCVRKKLPICRSQGCNRSFQGGSTRFHLDEVFSKRIKSAASRLGVTPYIVCLSALNILLYETSGESDIVVGTATAGRNQAAYKETLGYFVNPLPLRSRLLREDTVLQHINNTKKRVDLALSHQSLPFQRIVELAEKTSVGSVSPLFQVMFAYQSLPRLKQAYPLVASNKKIDFTLGDFDVSSVPVTKDYSQFDLTLTLIESDIGYDGLFEYKHAQFTAKVIDELSKDYVDTLSQMIDHVSMSLGELIEHRHPSFENQRSNESFVPVTAHLEVNAQNFPNSLAIKDSATSYSYLEFAGKVNRLSHWLHAQNLEKESVVGVHMERNCEYSIAMTAIINAGFTYLPLDVGLPSKRLDYIVNDAVPALIFFDESNRVKIQALNESDSLEDNTFIVNPAELDLDSMPAHALKTKIDPEQLAYIIYTSGSTGTPKGVLCTHHGLRNCIEQCSVFFELDATHNILQSASYSFDASIWNSFLCLYVGASLFIPNQFQLIPGPDLVNLINTENINYSFLSPTLLAEIDPKSVPGLEKIVAGGEELPARTAHKWFQQGRQVFNAYGPTEASICVTVSKCISDSWTPHIGKPLSNVTLMLVDDSLRPVELGQEGEIYIAGIALARSYLNCPERDRESFIYLSDPHGDRVRFYKTGDRAIFDEAGNLHYIGRKDNMVKIAGHRIELDEIRNLVLQKFTQVDNAVVIVKDEMLHCFYVCKNGELNAEKIRDTLKQYLPSYMLPASFTSLSSLPQMPSGKVDLKALREHSSAFNKRPEGSNTVANSRTLDKSELANILHECWRSVLAHDQFGNDDLFFDVGGTSILMARLHYLLEERLSTQVTMVDLYQYSSINTLVQHLCTGNSNTTLDTQPSSTTSRAEMRLRARRRTEQADS